MKRARELVKVVAGYKIRVLIVKDICTLEVCFINSLATALSSASVLELE